MKKKIITSNILFKALPLVLLTTTITGCSQLVKEAQQTNNNTAEFKGKIALDIRDSQSDWSAYTPKSAPKGSPNILFVLYD
ncbi:MAG: hypothetical protein KAJ63_04195, partial [Methyloprofundus sp.]|nr:hypothetical protein [Methyloprofundus sp.]